MYRPTSTSTSTLPYSNGHLSPPSNNLHNTEAMTSASESDLSDAIDPPNAASSSSQVSRQDDNGTSVGQPRNIESMHEEDAVGSDDGDFDTETPPLADAGSPDDVRSSSQDSRRNGKRKAEADHDDYMLENPELYGLRRSVGKWCALFMSYRLK